MMLRVAIAFLALANVSYFAWGQGWLSGLGMAPMSQSESWRLNHQVLPEALVVLTDQEQKKPEPQKAPSTSAQTDPVPSVSAVQAPAPPPQPSVPQTSNNGLQCWQAGPFDEAQTRLLRQSLRANGVPSDAWQQLQENVSGRWMVYLSQPSAQAAASMLARLRSERVDAEQVSGRLAPGLSLGRFSSEEAATRQLTALLGQGLRGARIVQERPSATLYTLRFEAITPAQHTHLRRTEPAFAGDALVRCE